MTRALLAGLALCFLAAPAGAHPLGNFTVNRYAALAVEAHAITVHYVVDMAEIPTFRELRLIDTNGDHDVDEAEEQAYLQKLTPEIARNMTLTVDGTPLALAPGTPSLQELPGSGGLATLRLDLRLAAPLDKAAGSVVFKDKNYAGRPGWQEIVATGGEIGISDSSVPAKDQSDQLRAYPENLLQSPPQVSEATFRIGAGVPAAGGNALPAGLRAGAARFGDRMTELVATRAPLGPWLILSSLLVAASLGALHALSPGHGKTIVGAYLVGTRGTAKHAIFLGLVVTATHTLGVYLLGLLTLTASAWVMPERLFPWIGVVSGLIVVAIGASLAASRLQLALAPAGHGHDHGHDHDHAHDHDHHHHDHDHDHHHGHGHSHLPPADMPIGWRSLFALGVSGGLLPCPSALVVMLGAIALGRVGFGLLLIVAFSVGLAAVLTGIGLALVYARDLFEQLPLDGRFARYVPVASALVISVAGLAIVAQALAQIGV
jgi:nickel/cobalt exporter